MATHRVQCPHVFVNGRRVGQVQSVLYKIGRVNVWLTLSCVVPESGLDADLVTPTLTGDSVDVGIGPVDGKLHTLKMRCLRADFSGSHMDGSLVGEFGFCADVSTTANRPVMSRLTPTRRRKRK